MAKTMPPAETPAPAEDSFHINKAQIEGLVVRLWTHTGDVYARLACYDKYAETLSEDSETEAAETTAGARRRAHYFTLCLKAGQTLDGQGVTLQPGDKVLATGYLRDQSYSETLARIFEKNKLTGRIQPGDEKIRIGRSATHLCVESLVRLGR